MPGTLDNEDLHCRIAVRETPCILVSIDYRLAPRYLVPIPIDDYVAVFEWVTAAKEKYEGKEGNKVQHILQCLIR